MKIFWYSCALLWALPLYATESYKDIYQQARDAELAGQTTQALSFYQQAIAKSRQVSPKDAAAMLYAQASLLKEQHQFANAKQAFEESLQLREQHLGKDHGSVAISLNGLASIYMAIADYEKAEEL